MSYPIVLTPGRFTITDEDDRMIRETSGAPPRVGGEAHPIFAFIAALGGLGMPIEAVFAACGGSIAAGPVLASCTLRFTCPLAVGITYRVTGSVDEVTRKPSRRFGAADHLRLTIDVADGDRHHSTLSLTIIMPIGDKHG